MRIDHQADRSMIVRLRGNGMRGPWLNLLGQVLRLAGERAELLRHSEKPWASVTFTGSRHTVSLAFAGPDALDAGEVFIAALPDHEFAIPGQIVADAVIISVDQTALPEPKMTIETELLLLEDC